ncbi:efflux transporter outer membrane subunit [Photobacterium frigidiphilum]|uniref:efflux transporter outer membrane subunit n=1 Tax=Photobacterium frigidiphilum TaxID=264736 RepID=UPI003D125B42
MKTLKWSPIALVLALMLTGCAVGPDYQKPEHTIDTEYLYQDTNGTVQGDQQNAQSQLDIQQNSTPWWYQFDDTVLNQLVADAQRQNIPLKMAAERIKAAQAYQQAIESFKVPTVSLGAGYSTAQFSDNDPLLGPVVSANNPLSVPLMDDQQSGFFAGATIAWEVDLFGRIDSQAQAASIRKEQAIIFREGLNTAITADVIHNYLQMRGAQERKSIAIQTVNDQKTTLALVNKVLASGYGSELDLARAKAMLAASKAVVPQLATAENVHRQRLAILLGDTPSQMHQRLKQTSVNKMPDMTGLIPVGLPSDLLQRRPDLRIAEREMAAINEELGAAIAAKYPKFFLTGAPGLVASDFDDVFSSSSTAWIASVGVSWNIFDGGRSDAMVDIQEARFKNSALSYQYAVNNAIGEVETLLQGYGNSQEYQSLVLESKQQTDRAVSKAESLYEAGLVDYLSVLDAQRQQHLLQDRVVTARLQTAQVAVGLHKALGGNWQLNSNMTQ